MSDSKKSKFNESKWALVTGASSGIGRAFVNLLASKGFNIVLLARNVQRLNEAAKEVHGAYGVQTFVMSCDLGKEGAAKNIVNDLNENEIVITALVNNAGYGDLNSFMSTSWDSNQKQINAMLCSVTELCYLLGQRMKQQEEGWIINVASLAAFTPNIPGMMYNGIKSYVVNFTEALDLELKQYNVNCLALCPGLTSTNFPKAMDAEALFAQAPKWRWMTPEKVAIEGYRAVKKGRSIHIPGKLNRVLATAYNVIPFSMKNELGRRGLIL